MKINREQPSKLPIVSIDPQGTGYAKLVIINDALIVRRLEPYGIATTLIHDVTPANLNELGDALKLWATELLQQQKP